MIDARTEEAASRPASTIRGRPAAITWGALALLIGLLSADAHAQSVDARWPERPIRFIVPFTAGSSSDIVARLVAQKLAERLDGVGPPKLGVPIDQILGAPEARGATVSGTQVHSVRLPSFVVSTEVVFAADGERLSIPTAAD